MKLAIVVAFLACCATASLGARAASPASSVPSQTIQASGQARVGDQAPWFAAQLAGRGNEVVNRTKALAGLQGRGALVISFFGTWCWPCRAGLEVLARDREPLEAAGIHLLLVALLEQGEDPEGVRPWLAKRGLEWDVPIVIDRYGRQMARPFGAETEEGGSIERHVPLTIVIGPDGRVRLIVAAEGADFTKRLLEAAIPAPSPHTAKP